MTLLYLWAKVIKKIRGSAIINSFIDKTSKIESGSHIVNSKFGRHSFCGYNCEIINAEIGSFCSIANNVVIGGSQHPMEWASTSPVFILGRDSVKKKYSEHEFNNSIRTIIGHDVWIGESVLIKQGVNIGVGAIIGMGSVVTKDVDPYCIVGGCPAKIIRKRFDEKVVIDLQNTKWWELDDDKLSKCAQHVADPIKFIEEVNE